MNTIRTALLVIGFAERDAWHWARAHADLVLPTTAVAAVALGVIARQRLRPTGRRRGPGPIWIPAGLAIRAAGLLLYLTTATSRPHTGQTGGTA